MLLYLLNTFAIDLLVTVLLSTACIQSEFVVKHSKQRMYANPERVEEDKWNVVVFCLQSVGFWLWFYLFSSFLFFF